MIALLVLCAVTASAFGRDHTIVGAKEFRVGAVNNVVLNLHGYAGTANVEAFLQTLPEREHLFAQTSAEGVDVAQPYEFNFEISQDDLVEPSTGGDMYVELHINVDQSNENFRETIPVLLNFTSGYLFVTTDRPAYRPGEKMNIVAVLTDQNLRETVDVPVEIVIKTPTEEGGHGKIGVLKVDKTTTRRQFMTHEYQIPPEPLLGKWYIEVSAPSLGIKSETTFLIDKYTLPTFNVKVKMDRHFVLPTANFISGTINAEYSYGKRVTGSYFMFINLVRGSEVPETVEIFREPASFTARAGILNGRKSFEISTERITDVLREGETMNDLVAEGASLTVEVAVTGRAESIYETDIVSGIRFTSSPYLIVTDRSSRYFNPGIVYEVKADVLDAVTRKPINNVRVSVRAGEQVKTPTSDERGEIVASFDRTHNAQELQITLTTAKEGLRPDDQFSISFTALRHQAGALMSISLNTHGVVGQTMEAQFRFEPNDASGDIRYYIVSKGQVVSIGSKLIPPGHRGDITHEIPVTHQMVPSARLVAYYMRGNELISNSVWFDVTNVCGGEELTLETSVDEARPGDDITITATGNSGAYFHLSAVDRAAYFVYNGSRLTRDVMWNKMHQYDSACSREGGSNNQDVFEEAGLFVVNKAIRPTKYAHPACPRPLPRRKRQADVMVTETNSRRAKHLAACKSNGEELNFSEETCRKRKHRVWRNFKDRNCTELFYIGCLEMTRRQRRNGLGRSNDGAQVVEARVRKQQRTNFEENWLFLSNKLSNDGRWSDTRLAPGSISTFEFSAFSSSPQGFCVAKPAKLLVFKKVFIQLYLPYSVRLMEQASIRYSVFNYNPGELEVNVEMRHSKELCSQFSANQMNRIATLLVDGNSAKSSYFTVMPIKIAELEKGASIEMTADSPGGNDALRKYLLIEPSGFLNESSKTFVLTPPDHRRFTFSVPNDGFEPNTRQCWIYAYANILGPIATPDPITNRYNNLQALVHRPAGCGEQNMIRTAPIVFIHKYRLATGQVQTGGPEEEQVINYIRQGWGIELNWRSDLVNKKAWAVWNGAPPSVWLNAFVDRVFVEARDIMVDLDPAPICSSLVWLLKQQKTNGRFVESFFVIHREMDGLVEGEIAMTAYVAVTLGMAGRACPGLARNLSEARDSALLYVNDQSSAVINNAYVTAVTAYGLAMSVGYANLAGVWNNRLRDLCTETAQHIYCESAGGQAGRVETTSYALLAQIALVSDVASEDEMLRVRKMALWLVEQRNSFGGSQTTQDTVMALQASAEYMKWIHRISAEPAPTNMNVTFSTHVPGADWHNEPVKLLLDESSQVVRQELEVPNNVIGTPIDVNVAGVGEASMSYRCTWRENVDGDKCQFNITVQTTEKRGPQDVDDPKTYLKLKINIYKLENPQANMSIVDVGLVSGYVPVQQSIDKLVKHNRVDGIADRYEITDNSVKFYLSEVNQEDTVLAFKLVQEGIIKNPQPAAVKVYDYYNPEISCSKFYALDDRVELRVACGNAAERSERICKCAEGGCPKCRKREAVAADTKCIRLPVSSGNAKKHKQCGTSEQTCDKPRNVGCFDSVVEACKKSYLFYVAVTAVRKNHPPNFVEFDADVVFNPKSGLDPRKGPKTFRMRFDCFENCQDEALTKSSDVDVIKPGRNLIIYGNEPQRMINDNEPSFLYNLDETAIIEVTQSTAKCKRFENIDCESAGKVLNPKCRRKRLCTLHERLRKMVFRGCG